MVAAIVPEEAANDRPHLMWKFDMTDSKFWDKEFVFFVSSSYPMSFVENLIDVHRQVMYVLQQNLITQPDCYRFTVLTLNYMYIPFWNPL